MKGWYSLLHSYQYLPSKKFKLVNNNTEVHDKYGDCVLGLKNIPSNNNLFKVELENIKQKKKSLKYKIENNIDNLGRDVNYKIMIKLNINKLIEMINNGDSIPFRVELFKLLRRNLRIFRDKPYQEIIIKKIFQQSKKQNIISCNLMSYHFETMVWISERERCLYKNVINNNIIKIDKLFLDLKKERFYIGKNSNIETKINIKGGIILDSNVTSPHISLLYNLIMDNNKLNIDPNMVSNKLISNNTLIITLHSNIEIWKNILDKSSLDYLIIQNKSQLVKLTYRNIISKKLIILSLNCLTNTTYLDFWTDYISNNQTYKEALETLSEERTKNRSLINCNKVIFQLIYWNRIIFDNIVSTINHKNAVLKNMIYLFECNKRWILENSNDHQNIYDLFFRNTTKINKINLSDIKFLSRKTNINEGLHKFFCKKVLVVKGNNIEKKFYSNLTCDNEKKFFESLSSNFLKINQIKLSEVKKNVPNFDLLLNDKCSICLEKLKIDNLGITSCNHLFCYDCLLNCIKSNNTCPKCRSDINNNKIYKIVKDYSDLSSDYSKISFIIKYLKKRSNILIISIFQSSLDTLNKFIDKSRIDLLNFNHIGNLKLLNRYSEIIVLESIEIINSEFIELLSSKLFKNNNFFKVILTEIKSSFT